MGLVLENYRLYLDQRRAFESTISALVHSLSLKDPATAGHSLRVRNVSVYLGLQLGLTDRELESLRVASLLHDMGKQGVSDKVLLKPGRLSDTERDEMSQHSEMTQNILDKISYPPHLQDVPMLAAYHHEKMDGSGPFKLAGEAIPIQSRIIAIADVFDALVSARVYKKPMSPDQALAILDKGKNLEFDPRVVDTLRTSISGIIEEIYGDQDGEIDLAA
jgi:HD-GYP domain-containing protein (c-di-GMP phosphodiesterase class II)